MSGHIAEVALDVTHPMAVLYKYVRTHIDRLVLEVQRLTKAPSKVEAVRRALTHEIERARSVQSVSERLAEAVRMAGEIGADNPDFDMKAYSDELSGGL